METKDRELMYLYISSMMIIIPTGFGVWLLFDMLAGISAMFVAGGFLVYLRTIMTIKIAELEIHLKPILVGNE